MSALLQSPNLFRSLRRVNEQEAILTIGRLALRVADAAEGLEALSGVALRLSGVHGVEIQLHSEEVFEWHNAKADSPKGTATGLMTANGHDWGKLRLLFEPRIKSVECPLRFTRVLAQQAALMLNRLAANAQIQSYRAAARRLEGRLETRKAVSRAAGILAQAKNLQHQQALLLLLQQARETRRSPLVLARTLILSAEIGRVQPIELRRLQPNELTRSRETGRHF
jgi:hypothetical protein